MTDSVLIIGGRAHEIWRGVASANLPGMHPEVLAKIVETDDGAANVGDIFANGRFAPPSAKVTHPSPIILAYDDFRARWTAGELSAMAAALTADPRVLEMIVIARSQGNVNLASEIAAAAKALFVEAGVLTTERAAEVFGA